jgi:hypothetical protein
MDRQEAAVVGGVMEMDERKLLGDPEANEERSAVRPRSRCVPSVEQASVRGCCIVIASG